MITKRYYQELSDLDLIYSFLSRTYAQNHRVDNWDVARWLFNRFCIHSAEELSGDLKWVASIQLWEDESGIVGVSHAEEEHDYFIQIDQACHHMMEEIILATLDHSQSQLNTQDYINISSLADDKNRVLLFEKYSGTRNDFVDDNRKLALSDFTSKSVVLEDYVIKNFSLENQNLCGEIAKLYQRIWPESQYIADSETVMNLGNAEGFEESLSFVLCDSEGGHVAFYILWSDESRKHAHLYPFGVERCLLENHVVEVFLVHGIKELTRLGYESLTLGAWYGDEDEKLFQDLGFVKTSPCVSYRFSFDRI